VLKIEERTDEKSRERKFLVPGMAAPQAKSTPDDDPFLDEEITLQ
jgi:hypothetical protein